jgi:hypothetical protein
MEPPVGPATSSTTVRKPRTWPALGWVITRSAMWTDPADVAAAAFQLAAVQADADL